MTLPASGNPISLGQVNTELSLAATAQISMNDAAVRTLFGIGSGAIDLNTGHGKSNTAPPVNTGAPSVSGTAQTGSVLSCSTGSWTGTPTPTYAYQWQHGTTNIASATASTYTLDRSYIGETIRCVVTGTNTVTAVAADSNATSAVVAVPLNTVAPAVTGTAAAGSTLSCSTGTWTGTATITYAYQWQHGTTNIAGATSATYALDRSYMGETIRCVVTGTNTQGNASGTSNSTSVVNAVPLNTGSPSLSGTASLGSTLYCSTGSWTGYPTPSLSYAWSRGGSGTSYVCVSGDIGSTIYCQVTGSNSAGSAAANSNTSGAVTDAFWSTTTLGGYTNDVQESFGVSVDSSGNTWGVFPGNNPYIYVVKYSPSGSVLNTWRFQDTDTYGISPVNGAYHDSAGNFFFGYRMMRTVSPNPYEVVIVKLNSSGSIVAQTGIRASYGDQLQGTRMHWDSYNNCPFISSAAQYYDTNVKAIAFRLDNGLTSQAVPKGATCLQSVRVAVDPRNGDWFFVGSYLSGHPGAAYKLNSSGTELWKKYTNGTYWGHCAVSPSTYNLTIGDSQAGTGLELYELNGTTGALGNQATIQYVDGYTTKKAYKGIPSGSSTFGYDPSGNLYAYVQPDYITGYYNAEHSCIVKLNSSFALQWSNLLVHASGITNYYPQIYEMTVRASAVYLNGRIYNSGGYPFTGKFDTAGSVFGAGSMVTYSTSTATMITPTGEVFALGTALLDFYYAPLTTGTCATA